MFDCKRPNLQTLPEGSSKMQWGDMFTMCGCIPICSILDQKSCRKLIPLHYCLVQQALTICNVRHVNITAMTNKSPSNALLLFSQSNV